MQAVPAVPAVPVAVPSLSYPDLLPGPFFLLLLLPAIPLLLFSVGARPPDSSSLPFTTNDLWQTTALVTVAGAVVLCVGLYPGLLSGMGGWVVSGDYSAGFDINKWVDKVWVFGASDASVSAIDMATTQVQVSQPKHPRGATPAAQYQYQTPQGMDRPGYPRTLISRNLIPRSPDGMSPKGAIAKGASGHSPRRGLRPSLQNKHGGHPTLIAPVQQVVTLDSRNAGSPAERHLAHLRTSRYFPWYTSSRPTIFTICFATIITTFLFIVIVGKVIGDGYDADSKSRPSPSSRPTKGGESGKSTSGDWVQVEYEKRKKEKDTREETIARVNKDRLEWENKYANRSAEERAQAIEKRGKELAKLRGILESKKLPLVGLEPWGSQVKVSKTETKVDMKEESKTGRPLKSWEKFLLGKKKTNGTKAEKRKVTIMDTATEGPGWKISDQGVSQVAMAQQASRAEELARGMKAA